MFWNLLLTVMHEHDMVGVSSRSETVRVSASAHSSWISSEFAFWNAEEIRRRQEKRIRECACMWLL
jgi:hypothetical protein